jgi:hypothetical protein
MCMPVPMRQPGTTKLLHLVECSFRKGAPSRHKVLHIQACTHKQATTQESKHLPHKGERTLDQASSKRMQTGSEPTGLASDGNLEPQSVHIEVRSQWAWPVLPLTRCAVQLVEQNPDPVCLQLVQ